MNTYLRVGNIKVILTLEEVASLCSCVHTAQENQWATNMRPDMVKALETLDIKIRSMRKAMRKISVDDAVSLTLKEINLN